MRKGREGYHLSIFGRRGKRSKGQREREREREIKMRDADRRMSDAFAGKAIKLALPYPFSLPPYWLTVFLGRFVRMVLALGVNKQHRISYSRASTFHHY